MPADGIPRRRRTRGKVGAELGFSTNQLPRRRIILHMDLLVGILLSRKVICDITVMICL